MSKFLRPLSKISGSNVDDLESTIEVVPTELITGDEEEIMDDSSDESEGDYLEFDIVEKDEGKKEQEEGEEEGEEDNGEVREPQVSFVETSSDEEQEVVEAPRAFIRIRNIKNLSTNLLFRISEFLTIDELTKSFLRISKAFSRIKLMKYVTTKKFLDEEYAKMLDPKKGIGRLLMKKILLFKDIDLSKTIPWPSEYELHLPTTVNKKTFKNSEESDKTTEKSENLILNFFTYSCYKGFENCVFYMMNNLKFDATICNEVSLFFSISSGSFEVMKQLLKNKIFRRIRDGLFWAIEENRVRMIRVLANDERSGFSELPHQKIGLMIAIQRGKFEAFEKVLSLVLSKTPDIVKNDKKLREDIIIELINQCDPVKKKQDICISSEKKKKKKKDSSEDDSFKMMKYLWDNGIISDWGIQNNICLRLSCSFGRSDIVRWFLDENSKKSKNIDPSASNNEALLFSSEMGYFEIVRILLNDPRVNVFQFDNYAYRMAVNKGHNKIAKLLLKKMKKKEKEMERKEKIKKRKKDEEITVVLEKCEEVAKIEEKEEKKEIDASNVDVDVEEKEANKDQEEN